MCRWRHHNWRDHDVDNIRACSHHDDVTRDGSFDNAWRHIDRRADDRRVCVDGLCGKHRRDNVERNERRIHGRRENGDDDACSWIDLWSEHNRSKHRTNISFDWKNNTIPSNNSWCNDNTHKWHLVQQHEELHVNWSCSKQDRCTYNKSDAVFFFYRDKYIRENDLLVELAKTNSSLKSDMGYTLGELIVECKFRNSECNRRSQSEFSHFVRHLCVVVHVFSAIYYCNWTVIHIFQWVCRVFQRSARELFCLQLQLESPRSKTIHSFTKWRKIR